MWPEALEIIKPLRITDWTPVQDFIHDWTYLGRTDGISREHYDSMRSFAGQMLRDIASIALDRPGILSWINQTAENLGDTDAMVAVEHDFETLHPRVDAENMEEVEGRSAKATRLLAAEWSKMSAPRIAEHVNIIEQEARSANMTWPNFSPLLSDELATLVDSPLDWARAYKDVGVDVELTIPFLRRAAELEVEGWIQLLQLC